MHIEQVTTTTPELVVALEHLVPQLTSANPPPSREDLEDLLEGSTNTLLIAREPDAEGPIVAMACLGTYRVPTGKRAIIEDVVVDVSFRGRGIAEALLRRLLDLARASGVRGVSLTSHARRVEANRLYLRLGFARRETNIYYCSLA